MVVFRLAWPSHWLMVAKSTPALRRKTAVVCRMECGWIRLSARVGASFTAATTYFCSRYRKPKRVIARPRLLRKTGWSAKFSVRHGIGLGPSTTVRYAARWDRCGPCCPCREGGPDVEVRAAHRERVGSVPLGPERRC